jgi:hypothetical protein
MTDTPPVTVIRKRPTPVTILAAVQLISSAGYALSVAAVAGTQFNLLGDLADRGLEYVGEEALATAAVVSALSVLAVVGFVAAILLFRMRQLGWTLTMLVAGVSLAAQVYAYWSSGALTVHLMLIQVVIVLYLNQREVRAAFGIGVRDDGSMAELDERG